MLFFWLRIFPPKLATKATLFVLDKFERKTRGTGTVRAGKVFALFISNEDMDDIIKILESLENSGLLIDGTSGIIRHKIKKQEGGFLGAMMTPLTASLIAFIISSLIQPVVSSLINTISGKGQKGECLPLLASSLMVEALGKEVTRAGSGFNNMDKNC